MKMKYMLFFLLFNQMLMAQPNATTSDNSLNNAKLLIEKITNVKLFVDYTKLKKQTEKELKALNTLPSINAQEYAQLQQSYQSMKENFDEFLTLIKQDVMDYKNVQQNAPANTSLYAAACNKGIVTYNTQFRPTYQRTYKTRDLPTWLLPFAMEVFDGVNRLIKQQSGKENLVANEVLAFANQLLIKEMRMKAWQELVTIQPSSSGNTYPPSNTSNYPANDSPNVTPTQPPIPPITNHIPPTNTQNEPPPTTNHNQTLPTMEQPTMKTLKGNIKFVLAQKGSVPQKNDMLFDWNAAQDKRNLVVGSAENTAATFSSKETYPEGTAFQIRVQNSGLLYVFALNSNGKCYKIYPFSEDWVRGFNMSKKRDLITGPLMLQSTDGETVIPTKNAQNGTENYIKIQGQSDKEQLCIVVAKSELNLDSIIAFIEQQTGTLSERMTAYATANPHITLPNTATAPIENDRITFDVKDTATWVMPFVFEIKR